MKIVTSSPDPAPQGRGSDSPSPLEGKVREKGITICSLDEPSPLEG